VIEAKPWWKFALYASYVQGVIVADNFEFKIPRQMYEGFSTACLKSLHETFYPEIAKQDNQFVNKAHPDTYYSFKHRRHWAKIRRAGYFSNDAESALRSLLHDELHYYKGVYDFT
jgi:hypothetical protein